MNETRTVYIAIDNSDGKLSQARWSDFVSVVQVQVKAFACNIHFAGSTPSADRWQKVVWIAEFTHLGQEANLEDELRDIASDYQQDSIAWAVLGPVTSILPTP